MVCRYDEYACSDNDQCIPKDFQCDLVPDCKDFSDEIGCCKFLVYFIVNNKFSIRF